MGFEAITGPNWIVPTAPAGDSSNRVADTAFVAAAISSGVSGLVSSVTASTGLGQNVTTGAVTLFTNLSHTTASLSGDVTLNSVTTYFDGPSIAQGTTGTWWVSGQVTCFDTAGVAQFVCKLWDGSTIIDSAVGTNPAASFPTVIALSGFLASPTGNLKISVKDVSAATGKILFNQGGNSKDSTISAIRIS